MVSYDRLWETMEKRKISQYRLIKEFGLSSGQMSRLKKNTYVSTHTLGRSAGFLTAGSRM